MLRVDKRGGISDLVSLILEQIGLDSVRWCDPARGIGRIIKRVAGAAEQLGEEANRRGLHWVQVPADPFTIAG